MPCMTRRLVASCGTILLLLVASTACGDGSGDDSGGDPGGGGGATLTVYAASSLTTTFQGIGAAFEDRPPGVPVQPSFGGSPDLVAQLQQGAPADVFASADEATMAKVTGDDLAAG